MADDYTPTTEDVRNVYCREYGSDLGSANASWYAMAGDRFDRWLAAHDAALLAERDRYKAVIEKVRAAVAGHLDEPGGPLRAVHDILAEGEKA